MSDFKRNEPLKTVKVCFDNPKYDYITDVSARSTKESLEEYFVGARLNMGSYPIEDMQICTSIELLE